MIPCLVISWSVTYSTVLLIYVAPSYLFSITLNSLEIEKSFTAYIVHIQHRQRLLF